MKVWVFSVAQSVRGTVVLLSVSYRCPKGASDASPKYPSFQSMIYCSHQVVQGMNEKAARRARDARNGYRASASSHDAFVNNTFIP